MLHLHYFLVFAALCFQSAVFDQGNVNNLHVTRLNHSLIIKKVSITIIVYQIKGVFRVKSFIISESTACQMCLVFISSYFQLV